jgi:hypothetical protein
MRLLNAELWHRLTSMFMGLGNFEGSGSLPESGTVERCRAASYGRLCVLVPCVPVAERDFSCCGSWVGGEWSEKAELDPVGECA